MQILALGCVSHFLPAIPLAHQDHFPPDPSSHCCSMDQSHEHVWGQWALSGHSGWVQGQEEGVSDIQPEPVPPELLCATGPSLHQCVTAPVPGRTPLSQNSRPALLPCTPNTLAHHLHATKILTTLPTPKYLLKALPHRNAALFYWGSMCVLFNSERQEPRIAHKINVNQL